MTSYPNNFTDNSAWGGGAIANGPGGVASLENDTYSGNSATLWGGAMYNAGALTVYGCTLSGNKAEFGGGLFNYGGTVTLNTATLAGNTATGSFSGSAAGQGDGGAIENGGAMTLTATTVSGNSGYLGGGIDCGDLGYGDSLTLVDSIVAANTWFVPGNLPANPTAPFYPDVCNAAVTPDSAYNLIGDGTGLTGIKNGANGNQIGTSTAPINPLLAPLGNYGRPTETMPPLSCSPALAAGGPVTALWTGIGAQDTALEVANPAVLESTPLPMYFEIDGELMALQSVNTSINLVTVSPRQAYSGYTQPESHNAGAGLYLVNGLLALPPSLPPTIGAVQPASDQLVVTSSADPASLTPGTLRAALKQANTDAANGISDTIMFAASETITLEQGPLELRAGSGTVTIDGGGQVKVHSGGASGVYVVDSGARLDLTGQGIAFGQAATGGGIDNSGTLTLTDVILAYNRAVNPAGAAYGGGIYNAGTATLTDCTIADNSATGPSGGVGSGGGVCNVGTLVVTDCTFSGNTASNEAHPGTIYGQGGGIFSTGGSASVSLVATTISANSAYSGGGIASFGSLTLTDTIVDANTLALSTGTAPDILGSAAAGSTYNLIGSASGLTGIYANKNHNLVAKVAHLAPVGSYGGETWTMALLPGSLAVGNGGGIAGLSTDQRGDPVTNPPCIGAYQTAKVNSLQVVFLGTVTPGTHASPMGDPPVTSATADTPVNVQVAALDASGDPIPNDNLPITATYTVRGSSATYNVLAPAGTPAGTPVSIQLNGEGTWTGPIVLHYPGTDTLTVSCGTINQGYNITVSDATAQSFTMNPPVQGDLETVGQAFNVTVRAVDSGDLQPIGYKGPFALAIAGSTIAAYASESMKDGVWKGQVVPIKVRPTPVTLTATALQGSPPATGQSAAFTVQAGPTHNITVSVPSSLPLTAGQAFTVTVGMTDFYGNPSSNSKLATITCTPNQNVQIGTTTNGTGTQTISVTLDKAGSFTLNVSLKTATGTVTAPPYRVTIDAGPADRVVVTAADSSVMVGRADAVHVQVEDTWGNLTSFTGSATFGGCAVADCDSNGVWYWPATVTITGGSGSQTMVFESCGTMSLNASVFINATVGSITGTIKNPVNIFADWFYNNMPDVQMQVAARADFYSAYPWTLNENAVWGLLNQAESDMSTDAANATASVRALGSSGGLALMPAPVQYLMKQVANPDPEDLAFLEFYYSADIFSVNAWDAFNNPNSIIAFGFNGRWTPNFSIIGVTPESAEAAEIQSQIQKICVPYDVTVTAAADAETRNPNNQYPEYSGVFWVQFNLGGVPVACQNVNFSGGGGVDDVEHGNQGSGIEVEAANGQAAEGGWLAFDTADAPASQLTALVNQWFAGTVYPNTTVAGGADGVTTPGYAPAGGASSWSLYGPANEALATDVSQGQVGDCWLMGPLADVAYIDPAIIEHMIIDNGNGTYTIHLYQLSGKPKSKIPSSACTSAYVTVDDELPSVNGSACFAGTPNGVLWVALIEKADAVLYGAGGPGVDTAVAAQDPILWGSYSYQSVNGAGCTPGAPSWVPGLGSENPLDEYAGSSEFALAEITGKSATMGWNLDGVSSGSIVNALNASQFVVLGTKPSALNGNSSLSNGHEYAVLATDSSGKNFLLYNPWGIQPAAHLTAELSGDDDPTDPNYNTLQVDNTSCLEQGDYVEVNNEMLLITGPASDGSFPVERHQEGTLVSDHAQETPVYLSLRNDTPWACWPIMTLGATNKSGLWWAPKGELSSFIDKENTTQPFGAANKPAVAPSANLGDGPATALPPAAAVNSATAGLGPISAAMAGSLVGMPPAQATPDQSQPGPIQVAAAVPVDRIKVASTAFTANAASGSSGSREASPGGSKLVGMAPLTASPPAHRRALTTSKPSPHPVPSMVRLPARWARQNATVKPGKVSPGNLGPEAIL